MLDATLITTLEKSLHETRNAQNRLMGRLREVELESERLREEIQALENSASQTESAIDGLLVAMRSSSRAMAPEFLRSSANLDEEEYRAAERRPTTVKRRANAKRISERSQDGKVAYLDTNRSVPLRTNNFEPISHRFSDRTITQACTLLLREAGKPLHVNELYNLLVAGGMEFKGNNPTISVAVSLNRNRRFRKVEPGTFDLVMRDASRAAS
jgi:hypothetical protein